MAHDQAPADEALSPKLPFWIPDRLTSLYSFDLNPADARAKVKPVPALKILRAKVNLPTM